MSEIAGLDLIQLGTVAGQDELASPALFRPLTTALAVLVGERLLANADPGEILVAGHGSGEIAAAVLAGILDLESGLRLAARVGGTEEAAAQAAPGGQVALLGGYPPDIEERAAGLGLSIAAYNGGGDMVLSGPVPALDALVQSPPRHTRAERLPAAGAFSSHLMSAAAADLRSTLHDLRIRDARYRLVSGRDGSMSTDGSSYLEGLAYQLTGSVRWDLIMDSIAGFGVRTTLELPPAGALSGLVVRGLPTVSAVAVNTPEVLAQEAAHLDRG